MKFARIVAASLILVAALPALPGCGGSGGTEPITISPEAKKADDGGQKAMEDFMKSQKQSKGKSRR